MIGDAQGGGLKATMCRLPRTLKQTEADLYKKILSIHCQHVDKENPEHQCTGAITLSSACLVARCKQCGDEKALYPSEQEPQ